MFNINDNLVGPQQQQNQPINTTNQVNIGTKHKQKRQNGVIKVLSSILIVGSLVGLGYLYYQKDQENKELQAKVAGVETSKEYNEILSKVKNIVNISDDVVVNIAIVDNIDSLLKQDPVFYKDVKIGQYVVVMPKLQKMLIYDKDNNKVVNFSSYTVKIDPIADKDIPSTEKPFNVEIRTQNGVTDEVKNKVKAILTDANPNFVVSFSTTNRTDFSTISVVLLNNSSKPKMSQNLLAYSGIGVYEEKLPEGEATSTADAVVFIPVSK